MDYVSANKNEKDLEIDWTIYLANALKNEKNGRYDYSKMKIVAADETDTMYIADKMLKNKKYRDAVDVLGFHYNSYMNKNVMKLNRQYGKEIWFSEGLLLQLIQYLEAIIQQMVFLHQEQMECLMWQTEL